MTARLLDGKALAARLEAGVRDRVAAAAVGGARRAPGLAVVRVGDDPASAVYVRNKERACAAVGMASLGCHLPATSTAGDIRAAIDGLNADPRVDGILLQLPLPKGVDPVPLQEAVDPERDVDGFHPDNAGRLSLGRPRFVPCTPKGVMALLDAEGIALSGARAVVVGRSNIVGKPMALLLLQRDATVTLCHSRTRDLAAVCREADVLVCATGVPGFLGADAVRPGAVVIDVGIGRVTDPAVVKAAVRDPERLRRFEAKGELLLGDVRFDEVREVASALTPVPGGVGPLTVALLLQNTWEGYARRLHLGP